MSKVKKYKTLIFGGITTVLSTLLLVFCFQKVSWHELWENIEHVQLPFIVLASLATLLIVIAKSMQIWVYLPADKKLPLGKVFQSVAILLMTISILPFWGGHALFVYLLGRRQRVGTSLALSIVTLDQVLDGFGKMAVFIAVAFLVPLPQWMKDGVQGFLILFLVAYVVTFLVAFYFRNHPQDLESGARAKSKIFHFIKNWAYNLKTIRDVKKIPIIIFFSILFRAFETLAVFLVQKGFGLDLPFYAPLLIVAAISLATLLPMAPGRIGVFEAAVFGTYRFLGVDPSLAMALALFIHIVHSMPFILTGYIVSLKTGFSRKELELDPQEKIVFAPAEP